MSPEDVPNATMTKFGYPELLVADYDDWVVLLRRQQVTLASLVLACRSPATEFSQIGQAAFESLGAVVGDIESCLRDAFAYDKINYLMLMMVDPHVHFHVLPRYGATRDFAGLTFTDAGWPAAPNLNAVNETTDSQCSELLRHLREHWPR
jgi:diadenosine tetraphosphate (Ap4A) HIT family hydrolase